MRRFKFIKSNKGSSLILVAALTVVIIGFTVSLRIMAGIIMASANQQLNQDQAYELAVSLGNSLEERIVNAQTVDGEERPLLDLKTAGTQLVPEMRGFEGMPDAWVRADVAADGTRYVLTVTSQVGEASYIWTGIYREEAGKGYIKCAE